MNLFEGIGRGIALQLAKCGAKVIALGRNEEDLGSLKRENCSIDTISVDLSDWTATRKALQNIGDVDLLVNNAGQCIKESITDTTEEHIDELFAINYKSVVNLTQIVTNNLLKRKASGSIVMVSSLGSYGAVPALSVYCCTKAAVDNFAKNAAIEFAPHNIRVNCVNPTVVLTQLGYEVWSDHTAAEALKSRIPLQRFAEINEVVEAVLFLLSDKAGMITGICLPIDGGSLPVVL